MSGDQIATPFPGSLYVDLPAADRRVMAIRYMRAMYGDHQGVVAFGIGANPYVNDKGKYSHKTFWQEFHTWPSGMEQAADAAIVHASRRCDVYVSPMLRKTRDRLKDNGAGGRWAWADLDGAMSPERLTLLRALGDSVRIVSSGTGHHAYFELDGWKSPDEIEATNRALRDMLGADAKWSNESLLRLPGTFNGKPVVFHGKPAALVQGVKL